MPSHTGGSHSLAGVLFPVHQLNVRLPWLRSLANLLWTITRGNLKLEERLKTVFSEVLKVDAKLFHEDLAVGDIPQWDSLGHAMLLQSVETEFKITLDVTDAIDIETIGDLVSTVEKYVGSEARK